MLFHTYSFLFIFLPIFWFGFYWAGKINVKAGFGILCLGSVVFYAQTYWSHTLLLASSIFINFILITAITRQQKYSSKRYLRNFGILFNLVNLGYFKYYDFVVQIVSDLSDSHLELKSLVLPLAISFYTFQQISLLVESVRRKTPVRFLDYFAFVLFFPQLIAGPIVRFSQVEHQYRKFKLPSGKSVCSGLSLFSMGLFKKVFIAGQLSPIVKELDKAVVEGFPISFIDTWTGSLCYSLELYFDFSGYTDMALGLALLFGIRLPINFDSPYQARSIKEFWQRWHITLSNFIRDYIYIPMGGNRVGRLKFIRNVLTAFVLGGVWHGAGWNFMIWGLFHGIWLCIHRVLLTRVGFKTPRFVKVGATFLLITCSWVIFRSNSFEMIERYFQAMMLPFGPDSFRYRYLGEYKKAIWMLAAILPLVFFAPNSQKFLGMIDDKSASQIDFRSFRLNARNAILTALVVAICFYYMIQVEEFIYFRF